jgi:4-alpha-glucanotransferase
MSESSQVSHRRKPNTDGKVKRIEDGSILTARAAGILLHPTSLPGSLGIGDLGASAYEFIDFLRETCCSYWQLLPLGPTGFGGSPYQCTSAFAGNPLLISLDLLVRMGLVDPEEQDRRIITVEHAVDFDSACRVKHELLRQGFQRFISEGNRAKQESFKAFKADHAWWLDDFVLYASFKEEFAGKPWYAWPRELARREKDALSHAAVRLEEECEYHRFVQFCFLEQWHALKEYAGDRGISVIGDIPIFPAHDSADVWAHSNLFKLDREGQPTVMAGVPPDYFSETGQLWGNPLYRWDALAKEEYSWWIQRFEHLLSLVDVVRLDHFRGFVAAWEVPAGETTAIKGHWAPGPGISLFEAAHQELGALPFIAEDLGVITPDVEQLKAELGLPGMKILQFAFDSDARNPHLPHNHTRESVVYTGTHDNDTAKGFYEKAGSQILQKTRDYLRKSAIDMPWDLIHLAYSSVANTCIVPLQDVLGMGSEARMNYPGRMHGNWHWRYRHGQLGSVNRAALQKLAETFGRAPAM